MRKIFLTSLIMASAVTLAACGKEEITVNKNVE